MREYTEVIKYKITAELASPMHIGQAESGTNEVLTHPVDHVPFIQASSLAGAMRAFAEKLNGIAAAEDLFGSQALEAGSRIRVSDGIFEEKSVQFELRPRVKIDPVSGTTSASKVKGTGAISGHKFDMEAVAAKAIFSFTVYVYTDDAKKDSEVMKEIFSGMQGGSIILGGQKSNGFGDIRIKKALVKTFNLKESGDLAQWIEEEDLPDSQYEDITAGLTEDNESAYMITLTGKTESGILVKGYKKDGFGEKGADISYMEDANGNPIIPGSSIKGTLRNQIDRILTYIHQDEEKKNTVLLDIFGESKADGNSGNVRVSDCVIKETGDKAPIAHRIHIDKLTAGVINKGLFSEQKTYGEIELKVQVMNRNNVERSAGLMILAMRDLAANLFNLGSGYSIGNGMIVPDRMTVSTKSGDTAEIFFKDGKVNDPAGILNTCVAAAKEAK